MGPTIDLTSLIDVNDQPVVLIDDSHRVVAVNKAFEEAYGVRGEQAANTPCYTLLARDRRPCPCGPSGESCPFADTFAGEGTRNIMQRYRDKEGRERVVQIQAYPIQTREGRVFIAESIQRDAARHHPAGLASGSSSGQMVGQSTAYRNALERLVLASKNDAPVLLTGDTGTGKELAAEFIHRQSARRTGPFQTLDCTVLTPELFESEVFGHERGAFTGSVRDKPGLFEIADNGTLFIDEIGELPLPLQAKLLRLLETGTFRRVGGTVTRRANVRFICATNRELQGAAWFRNDLYYRIACVTVRLPSLAERRSDIPVLAAEILTRISSSSGRRLTIDAAALDMLCDYEFPGNIRELRNVLWVASVNSANGHIAAHEVEMALPQRKPWAHARHSRDRDRPMPLAVPGSAPHPQPAPRLLRSWDRDELVSVLRRNRGNRKATARELGVSERTVYRKLREFGVGALAIGLLSRLPEAAVALETVLLNA